MAVPPLLSLADETQYRQYFLNNFVHDNVTTHHGIRVHFKTNDFDHAFYESSQRDRVKDRFSQDRSQRMKWINFTLSDSNADWFQGWIKLRRCYDVTRSVAVAYGDFVVVTEFRANRDGEWVAKSVICYVADNRITKIRQSPPWSLQDCKNELGISCDRRFATLAQRPKPQ
ncbi:MAG: hypothetical protein OXE84_04725 [Rhodobacteraceae bacterium]|nr:hypothetical protein [Paracoccaceae bacterium]MCY4196435.1 hypothetical protein [Paracoccaceae bacterium]MCY4326424.1 hypothetical protein [Paracoccaceae bacterium]